MTKFAKSKGIPRPEAILTVAALGLGKLVKVLDAAEAEAKEELAKLEAEANAAHQIHAGTSRDAEEQDLIVIDASDFENTISKADVKKADEIGKAAAPPPASDTPAAPGAFPSTSNTTQDKKKKKDDGCIII